MSKPVKGFSKLSKEEKITWLSEHYFNDKEKGIDVLKKYWNSDERLQQLHDEFIENTISNYYLPLGVAPNFMINGKIYTIPMAIEESSVVAAASRAAKFWMDRGGFHTKVIATEKIGQVHFIYRGDKGKLSQFFTKIKPHLFASLEDLTVNMRKRGGGITGIELVDKTDAMPDYFQLHCSFETLDAMGANFINSCLERLADVLQQEADQHTDFNDDEKDIQVVMSILSNYVPDCRVKAEVRCPVAALNEDKELTPASFANKFVQAVNIAQVEPFRAVTHNKGIMNGIDAVVLATGNDFRAVEAGIHAYAARDGQYRSLSKAEIIDDEFVFSIEIPLALGTVGGLTKLHPLVKLSLEILDDPTAKDLMQIVAVAGLAQNFAAVRSLITTGIQKGHMKMHLMNILNQMDASKEEKTYFTQYFQDKVVTHRDVISAVENYRKAQN
ncbi:hydroxymethylglutaryl-CoA reductase, degradative [Robertkochia marina]|uniref:3-hydroxy-3-methylglutaryl coenzyme A reductase n=1 Tax=Robertkochia marina TaxID=1227945 RepID=A0A4S3M2E8_9FLAO|nr:hydroxymethylglutaryl-CoA reductase, degradative [Robertkochia marina]THD68845.1 hydroxymethylglutaryl-CoA reductase, degradative [Robertkochia marina]TRZ43919.1 hydroxymethylglutaryl-CoA reductase, degradative [Robertkochia marina]